MRIGGDNDPRNLRKPVGFRTTRDVLLFVFLISTIASFAQPYGSRLGRFQVAEKKGCASFTVNLTNLLPSDCTPGKPCAMSFGDNSPTVQNVFTHTYTTAGTYTLSVIYQSIGADDIVITVDPNIQPNFEIYACSGAGAVIKVTDNAYDQYYVDFGDGTAVIPLPFSNNIITPAHNFALPGTYTTSVRGQDLNAAPNCTAKQQSFVTIPTLPTPSINTLTSIDEENITLAFTTAINIQYRLEIAVNNAATFQIFNVLYGVNTLAVSDLKLDQNYYCFRLSAFNPCNGSSTYSNTVCTSKLNVTAQSDVNVVTWATGPATNFSINRMSANSSTTFTIGSSTYNDTDVECKTNYCYRVTNNYGGGRTSVSLEKCVTTFSTTLPTAIDNASAIVSDNGVQLTWSQDPAFTPLGYSLFRSSAGGDYALYSSSQSTKFDDEGYATPGQFCYKIDYIDNCDNASGLGSALCPVQLTGMLQRSNVITVTWSTYSGWKNGVKDYTLRKYNLKGTLIKTITQTDTVFVDDQVDPDNQYVRYEVSANPNEVGITPSVSNKLEIIKNANLYYPTAFTPNNDKLNDDFMVSGQYIDKMNMTIFDRWGVVLYASDKKEPWDGQSKGKPLPASVYIWKAEITDLAGRTFSQEGTVALIRN